MKEKQVYKGNINDTFIDKTDKYTDNDYAQKDRFAKRLRALREHLGLSHEKLNEALSKKGIEISIKSLKNYEVADRFHTSYKSGLGISLYNLKSLADFFNVSIDYLLDNVTGKNPEYEVINKVTGLSNDAIDNLKKLNEFSEKIDTQKAVVSTMNLFLSSSRYDELLSLFLNMLDFLTKKHQELEICEKKLNELYNKYINNKNIKEENKTYLKLASKYCYVQNWITKTRDEILKEINTANKARLQSINTELLKENLKVFEMFYTEFIYEKNEYEKNIDFSLYKLQNQFAKLVKNI